MDQNPPPKLPLKGTWRTYTTADGLAGLQTEHIAEDAEGYLWIGIWGSGASRFDGDEFRTFTVKDGLPGNRVQALLLDRQGRLWFGTDGGVCWYDGKEFHRFDRGDGVSDKPISFIFEDREGRVWCAGSETLGYWDGSFHDLVPAYCHQHGQPLYAPREYDECEGIAQDCAGHLWFAFITNLVCYDGEDFHHYGEEYGLPPGRRTIGRDVIGDLWIGAGGALYRCEGQTFQPVPIEIKTQYIRKIQRDREGRTWFCTTGDGVFCYDGTAFHHFIIQDGLAYDLVNAMYQDREGQFWFATWGGGLSRYDPHGVQIFKQEEGLPHEDVSTLLEDRQGRIWIEFGTLGGPAKEVACCDGEGFAVFGKEQGLDSGWYKAICEDQRGHLWFGTDNGVVHYDGHVFQTIRTPEIKTSINDILQDRQGRFWFATGNGLVRYLPGQVPPRVRILQVVAGQVYEGSEEVNTFSQQILFEYKGLSFRTHPKDMLYTCRLLGREEDWQPATREMRALYQDLPVGEYTFQVRAIDRDLNYSEPASVRLKVIPDPRDRIIDELEQRVRERTWELEEKNHQLETANRALEQANLQIQQASQHKSQFLSRMSHDLRTPMNAILGYTRILLRKLQGTIDERQYKNLENIQVSASHLLSLINDILDLSRVEAGRIELKPEPVDLHKLIQECAASVASLLKPGVELRQQLEEVPLLRTDPDRLRRVLMNLLSNAVKFTEAGSITVAVKSADGGCELSVADTGVGIPHEELPRIFEEFRQVDRQGHRPEGSGLGLAIARKSIELLGGTILAESEVGRGTKFTLRLADSPS